MNYKFDRENGAFTVYQPETGKDWSNQLWNKKGYFLSVSHVGSTVSRYVDENNVQVSVDCPLANYVYLRDDESKDYWNIGLMPSCKEVEDYACTHAQEYSKISSTRNKIGGEIAYAVAKNDTYEVWKVTVSNKDSKTRKISVFGMMAFDLNGYAQPVYYSSVTTSATRFVKNANAVFCDLQNPYKPHDNSCGFIASSEDVFAFEGNLEKFIGTVGSHTRPKILEKGMDLTNSTATVRTRCGILQNKITLKAGESKTIYYVIGLIPTEEKLVERYSSLMAEAKDVFADVEERGEKRFGTLRTLSPCDRVNNIMNFWAQKQVSFCHIGKKAVRDNAQIGMGMLNFNASLAKDTINECLCHQYKDGHAVLTWYPYLEPNIYSDPSVWLILSTCEAIKETGDFDYLNVSLDYLDGGSDTVYGHLKKAVEWFLREDNYGVNGLPRIHHADWNDALNIPDDKAESIFMAMAICYAFEELAYLADYIGDKDYAVTLRAKKKVLADIVNEKAYNGEYYVRAFSKFGVVGDKDSTNGGKIYINPQSWAILADIVPEDRLQSVLNAIDNMETDEGIPLCSPAYQKYDETVGRMSGMLPGVYENGGIYNHAGGFKVMADCRLKRRDKALATLLKIIPDGEFNPSSKTTTEPYVFTNCYLKHPSVDMMVGFSWQTGSSAWGLMCYYEGILGLKRSYAGLKLDPCFPESWDKVSAKRMFRGNLLDITYINEGGTKVQMTVDGKAVDGNVIPLFDDDKEHVIVAKLVK